MADICHLEFFKLEFLTVGKNSEGQYASIYFVVIGQTVTEI